MSNSNEQLPKIEVKMESLPSSGKPYPEAMKIFYRTYTFAEMKQESASSSSPTRAIKRVMDCISIEGGNGFNKMDITIMDAMYMGVTIKMVTEGGGEFEFPYICWKCGDENKHKFRQTDLDFRDIDPEVEELPAGVKMEDGSILLFSPLTVNSYIDLYSGKFDAILAKKQAKGDPVASLAAMIQNMQFPAAYKYISGLTGKADRDILTEIDEMLMHDIKPLTFTCTNNLDDETVCNADLSLKLEGREALLRPFREGKSSIRSRIFYGNAPKHKPDGIGENGISRSDTAE